jgi:hypothetical protein
MTLDATLPIAVIEGNGVATQFSYNFYVSIAEHVKVTIQDRSVIPYADTLLNPNAYALDLANKRVTYPITGTPLNNTKVIIIERIVPLAQSTDLRSQSGYFAEDFEDGLDYLMQAVQQINAKLQRALIAPVGSSLDLQSFLDEYNEASANIQAAISLVASAFFVDVFTSSSLTFTFTQDHNGRLLRASPPLAGQVLTLPAIASLTLPYQLCVKLEGGDGTATVVPSGADTIDGLTSVALSTIGEWAMIVADNSGASAYDWTVIRNASVGSASIADGSVTTSKLADNAVTAAKVGNSQITMAKIANQTASSLIGVAGGTATAPAPIVIAENSFPARATGGVIKGFTFGSGFTVDDGSSTVTVTGGGGGGTPDDNSVSTIKIQNNAVTAAKIATDTITGNEIANNAIGTGEIANSAVTLAKMANLAAYNILANVTNASAAPAGLAIANNSLVAKGTGNIKSFSLPQFTFDDTGNAITLSAGQVGLTELSTTVNALFDGILGVNVYSYDNTGSPFTFNSTHRGSVINVNTSGGAVSITLPQISGSTNPYAFIVKRTAGSSAITLNRSSTDTFNGGVNTSFVLPTTIGSAVLVIADFSGATAGQWTTFSLGADIAAGSITATELASNAVTTSKILDANITTAKIAASAVTSTELASNSVSFPKIVDGHVTTAKLQGQAVTTDKIADGSVTTVKIADGAVGLTQMSVTANSYMSSVPFGAVETISATITLTESNKGTFYNVTSTSTTTITLPTISGTAVPMWFMFRRQSGSAAVTIAASGGNTINGTATLGTTAGNWIWIVADHSGATAGNWYILS